MKLTLSILIESLPALARLSAQPAPAPLAFALAKVNKAVESELEAYNTARLGLCKQHGTLPKDKSAYEFTAAGRRKFDAGFKDLLATEAELKVGEIDINRLGDVTISGADLSALSWLITGEPAE